MRTVRFIPGTGRLLVNQDSTIAVTASDSSGLTAWSLLDAAPSWRSPSVPDAWALGPNASMLATASSRDVQIVDLLDASEAGTSSLRFRSLALPLAATADTSQALAAIDWCCGTCRPSSSGAISR